MGTGAAGLGAALLGALEGFYLARGDFRFGYRQFLEFEVAYFLVGATIGLGLVVTVLGLDSLLRRTSQNRARAPLVWYAIATWGLLGGILLNKFAFPAFFSPVSLLGNAALVGALFALRWPLSKVRMHSVPGRLLAFALFVLLVLAPLVAPGSEEQRRATSADSSSLEPAPQDAPNIVVALVDTLRADHLGAYGYRSDVSPAMDSLAAEAVVFDRAYSPSNWTRPSVATLMTSTLPSRHGVTEINLALPPDLPLLAESFQSAGYEVGFFTNNPNVEPEDGYWRGTDHFHAFSARGFLGRTVLFELFLDRDLRGVANWLRSILGYSTGREYTPESMTEAALEWISERRGPYFAYIHFLGPHAPYAPPERHLEALGASSMDLGAAHPPSPTAGHDAIPAAVREQMIAQYDGAILWHDEALRKLFQGLAGDTVVVLTSDHGEGFGETGFWEHGVGLFDEIVRIPLIFYCPGRCGDPRREATPASLIDVGPTLLQLAGLPTPASFDGRALTISAPASAPDRTPTVVIENPKNDETSLRTPDWNLVSWKRDDGTQRWLWPADEATPRSLAPDRTEVFAELETLLNRHLELSRSRARRPTELDLGQDRLEQLKALGYLD